MSRIFRVLFLSAGLLLGGPALADGDTCTANSSDSAVSFPDGSYDYIFVIQTGSSGDYGLCAYSPTVLDLNAFNGYNIADYNHDGWPDLLFGTSGASGGEVQLFLNDKTGSGIVVQQSILPTGGSAAPTMVGTLDLNGDGRPDILTNNGLDGTVSIMLNDGNGGFPAVKQYAVGSDPTSMLMVDLDGDGRPDIVATDYIGNAVDVLMNTGTGDFKPAFVIPVGQGPLNMQVADLNGDGHPDIVTQNVHDGTVSVLLNNGDGSFATPATYSGGGHLDFVSVFDTNGDGQPDIIVDFTWGAWYALLNNGDGTFAAPAWVPMPGGGGSGGVTITAGGSTGLIGDGTGTQTTGTVVTSSGSGKVIPPVSGNVSVTPAGGSTKSSGTGTKSGSGKAASGYSSGGGGMEWISLLLLGSAGLLRKRLD